jgi:hypothetical protein
MKTILAIVASAVSTAAMATRQIPDHILVGGSREAVVSSPGIPGLRFDETQKGLGLDMGPSCSASWRGYSADWEVDDGKLFLAAVHADPCNKKPPIVPLTKLFPNSHGPVQATWFTGRLVIPRGKPPQYGNAAYPSGYESYLIISVRAGVVHSQTEVKEFPRGE